MSRFEMQRDAHRLIRNDDDYDDWEYGAEPLPGETWLQLGKPGPSSPALPAAIIRPLSCEPDSILAKSNDLSTSQE